MNDSWPRAKALTEARRPLIRVRVALVPKPRSDTPDAPTGVSLDNAPALAVEKVPPPPAAAGSCEKRSITEVAPDSSIVARSI